MKTSPLGDTRIRRGLSRPVARSSTTNLGGAFGQALGGRCATVGPLLALAVAYGGGRTRHSFQATNDLNGPIVAAGAVLPSLRVHRGSGRMADDNRRPEHPKCNNTNEQKNGDDDRRNEVFHGLSLTGEPDRRQQSPSLFERYRSHWTESLTGTWSTAALQHAGEYCRR
jgi:hypothetical protein